MMRMIFALVVTAAGFLAASLWLARDGEPIAAGESGPRGGGRTFDLGAIASSLVAEIPAGAQPAAGPTVGPPSAAPTEEPPRQTRTLTAPAPPTSPAWRTHRH